MITLHFHDYPRIFWRQAEATLLITLHIFSGFEIW